jgi:hypothetical protein
MTGMDQVRVFKLQSFLQSQLVLVMGGQPALLFTEYFSPNQLILKRKLHVAVGCVFLSRRKAMLVWHMQGQHVVTGFSEVLSPA